LVHPKLEEARAQWQTVPESKTDSFLTLKEAADLVGKTPTNISYLIQYGRLNRYDPSGRRISRAQSGGLRVSRSELIDYWESSLARLRERMRELSIENQKLGFHEIAERERTKHVHRLHPYLGKFIPQLVEYFLSRYVRPGEVVVDPFCGSGTTLVQSSEMGIHSIGCEISAFNALIARVKLAEYNLEAAKREVLDVARRTTEFSNRLYGDEGASFEVFQTRSEYLRNWFAPRSLQEMLFFKSIIAEYEYRDLLKVLLSRTARSCRLIRHYELATPTSPVTKPYRCYKHQNKICRPVQSILKRLNFYSRDTIRRLEEFAKLRKKRTESVVIEGDSRNVAVERETDRLLGRKWFRRKNVLAVFTSPPYVGQIDYHEQHEYAYELFGYERRDGQEIGAKGMGRGRKAKEKYVQSISEVFLNLKQYTSSEAKWFVVANDSQGLYSEIFETSGLSVERKYSRPVEDRTERDKRPYSEIVFQLHQA
jgi:hypothetical protein